MNSPIKVVIAEDDLKIAEIQRRFLERIEGFELVGIAHGLAEAQDLVEVLQPELLLLDIQFPKGTGLDLLRTLRGKALQVDVIMITAAKEVETLREALRGGVFDYILKPLVFERLQEALQQYQHHIATLQTLKQVNQSDLNHLILRSNQPVFVESKEQRLPKGIDALTLEKIRQAFSDNRLLLNAEEVGERIGASRTTARRYLEYLTSTHDLIAEVSYGTVGRPERRYRSHLSKIKPPQ